MTIKIDNCQLEVDVDRGVLYVHSSDSHTLLRVCQIPQRVLKQAYDKSALIWPNAVDVVYDRELAKGRKVRRHV